MVAACRSRRRGAIRIEGGHAQLRPRETCGIADSNPPMDRPASSAVSHEGEHVRVGDEYYVLASSLASRRRKQVLSHEDAFIVLDQSGDVPTAVDEELGLFFRGMRHLSQLELLVGGRPPFFLSSAVSSDNIRAVANLTNNDLDTSQASLARSTVSITRTTLLCGAQLFVRFVLHSFSPERIHLDLDVRVGADFRDVFEVRGMHRARRGAFDAPRVDGHALLFGYRGLDGVRRCTRCEVAGADARWDGRQARVAAELAPEEERIVDVVVTCETSDATAVAHRGFAAAETIREREHRQWQAELTTIHADDEGLNAVVAQALADVFMLTVDPEPGTPHAVDRFIYAGIPWFATIFGRDALVTARELLVFAPGLARSVLRTLAALQGTRVDPERDEEPGKILHEARYGEMAATGEVPFGRYYGSVDATPLFLMLLGAYVRVTGDLALARELWPNACAALEWIERWGDRDGDGYVEYARSSEHGLANQGWKDSGDSVFHADGRLAEAPIALVEVQGYCYAAYLAMAEVADAIGVDGAARWVARAGRLRQRINDDFWMEQDATYALALDRDKRPCQVIASNAGHLLFCGVPYAGRARLLGARLLRADVFSGWGIRTLASGQPRYNPMSYHNGSVWPHDNALIAAGLRRFERIDGVLDVLTGLVESAMRFEDRRLPELFCGFGRRGGAPVPYPVACRPQAWAAGSIFLLLEAALGIELDALRRRVVFRQPQLPPWLPSLEVRNLRVGDARVDFHVLRGKYGGSIEILRKDGEVDVVETR